MKTEILNIKDALARSADWLEKRGIGSARLDAEVLLGDVLGMSRLNLYLAWDKPLKEEEKAKYREFLKRRAEHEPVAYIIGRREFFSREFAVGPGALTPRPETELLVEAALSMMVEGDSLVADVGTGSGVIAVTLALESPNLRVIATDISEAALKWARKNAAKHEVQDRLQFLQCPLLANVEDALDGIISNPPYVAEADRATLDADVLDHEPETALFAGPDGLDTIRQLIPAAAAKLKPGAFLAMEIGAGQANAVCAMLERDGRYEEIERHRDYSGIERIITARRKSA
ncbi:MAG: peptide chain release factor N(5)-glutamine methyltransferase [bacterium]